MKFSRTIHAFDRDEQRRQNTINSTVNKRYCMLNKIIYFDSNTVAEKYIVQQVKYFFSKRYVSQLFTLLFSVLCAPPFTRMTL